LQQQSDLASTPIGQRLPVAHPLGDTTDLRLSFALFEKGNSRMSDVKLLLLRGFGLTRRGQTIVIPPSGQRLMAFLAFQNGPVRRALVAGTLWSDTSDRHAAACLRSALWRIRRICHEVIHVVDDNSLELGRDVDVDVRQTVLSARSLIDAGTAGTITQAGAPPSDDPTHQIATLLAGELLPDWYEDWVVSEREQLRQLRLHALELLCIRLTAAGAHAHAVEVGLSAVSEEPLRETAHRVLISAYLAEGNFSEALRQFSSCESIFRSNLGLGPSQSLRSLVTLPAELDDKPLSIAMMDSSNS
jgi:DNA-binding SARP family transcriptional activator